MLFSHCICLFVGSLTNRIRLHVNPSIWIWVADANVYKERPYNDASQQRSYARATSAPDSLQAASVSAFAGGTQNLTHQSGGVELCLIYIYISFIYIKTLFVKYSYLFHRRDTGTLWQIRGETFFIFLFHLFHFLIGGGGYLAKDEHHRV